MKTTGASRRMTSQNQSAIAERDEGNIGSNADLTPSYMSPEAIGNESGKMEITPIHGSKEWDELPGGTVSTPDSLKEGGTSKLADPRLAK